jgi:hypothetical protein
MRKVIAALLAPSSLRVRAAPASAGNSGTRRGPPETTGGPPGAFVPHRQATGGQIGLRVQQQRHPRTRHGAMRVSTLDRVVDRPARPGLHNDLPRVVRGRAHPGELVDLVHGCRCRPDCSRCEGSR